MTTTPLARAALALLLAAAAAAPAAAQQQTPEARARQERERAGADRDRADGARARAQRARQQDRARGALRDDAERRAFEMLLNHRAELQLSDEQVRRLETIRGRLEQQNAPLRAQLMEAHQRVQAERRAQLEAMSAEQRREELRRVRRQGRPGVPQALQPTVRQMRLNINEAMHQAQGVLTADQRLRAQALLRAQAQRGRRPGVRGQQGRRPRRHGQTESRQP